MASKRKRNRLITGRKGAWGQPIPDMWIDELGIEWVLPSNADLVLSSIELADVVDGLTEQWLIECRTFTIDGRERTGWRVKFAALNFKLAMFHESEWAGPCRWRATDRLARIRKVLNWPRG